MNTDVEKLCWNCEEDVLVTQENCLSCGVYLSPFSSTEINQIFTPPYRLNQDEENSEDEEVVELQEKEDSLNFEEEINLKTLILSISLLLLGSLFLLFSFLMVLFGENGKLTLSWSTNYWYLYALLSPVLLFLGWRKL